ncbi:protein [Lentinula edodes]|uniref:Protein n=1 Tax=Lentinula edodes TaxID=5353 RepID=A0A1Q3EC97_LENED|nr:protein [Lentinula edodes]
MEDVISLKKDVHFYYNQYRQARLQVLELQEKLSRTRVAISPEQRLPNEVPNLNTIPISAHLLTSGIRQSTLFIPHQVASAVSGVVIQRDESSAESSVPSIASKVNLPIFGDVPFLNASYFQDRGSSEHGVQTVASISDFDDNIQPSNPAASLNSDSSSLGHARTSVTNTDNETGTSVNNDEMGARQKIPYPSDAPSFGWFYDAFVYLNVDLGTHYSNLLHRWVEHERKNQWKCPNDYREGFGKSHRPLLCNKWIRNRRYYRFQADVDKEGCSTMEFTSEVWDWWITLQPKRHLLTEGGTPPPSDESEAALNTLDKHGKHGWPVLLACVKWWAIGLQHHLNDDREEQKGKWVALVEDMTNMLEELQE